MLESLDHKRNHSTLGTLPRVLLVYTQLAVFIIHRYYAKVSFGSHEGRETLRYRYNALQ